MTGKEAYKIWAPNGAKWVDWVRPVLFISAKDTINQFTNLSIPTINYLHSLQANVALIIDLPGHESIGEAIALAKLGFRPVPLFNGTKEQLGSMPLVNNHIIENTLLKGAIELRNINIETDAPPVFMLDSNRTHRLKIDVSAFDNSWDLYDQDIPSAEYFINNKIDKIIVRGSSIQNDLKKILYKFQKKGITIFFTDGYEEAKKVTIKKPNMKEK